MPKFNMEIRFRFFSVYRQVRQKYEMILAIFFKKNIEVLGK
jgi:hypothetical protein